MERLMRERVLLVRVTARRGFHSTKPRHACRGTKDRSGSSGASLDDAWCKPGGIKCKKMWYDKEVEMSSTGSWVQCHSRPAGFTNLCGEICPPRRVLLRRTKQDLQICSWDCETMQLPPCWVFQRTWVHKLKCIISRIPRFLFIVLLIAISYKSGVWTIPDPNLDFVIEVRTALNPKNSEIFDAADFRRKIVKYWNTLIAYLFNPFAWLVGASSWTRMQELKLDFDQLCVKIEEEDVCEFECAEELCQHEVHFDPAEEALRWPQYRDLEQWRWQQEMDDLHYDKIPSPAISPHAYKFMPEMDFKGKCNVYLNEEYADAGNWMPPVGAVPLIEERKCYMKSIEALRMRIRRSRLMKLRSKGCPKGGCQLSLFRDRCMYKIDGCRCPEFLKPRKQQAGVVLPRCSKPEKK